MKQVVLLVFLEALLQVEAVNLRNHPQSQITPEVTNLLTIETEEQTGSRSQIGDDFWSEGYDDQESPGPPNQSGNSNLSELSRDESADLEELLEAQFEILAAMEEILQDGTSTEQNPPPDGSATPQTPPQTQDGSETSQGSSIDVDDVGLPGEFGEYSDEYLVPEEPPVTQGGSETSQESPGGETDFIQPRGSPQNGPTAPQGPPQTQGGSETSQGSPIDEGDFLLQGESSQDLDDEYLVPEEPSQTQGGSETSQGSPGGVAYFLIPGGSSQDADEYLVPEEPPQTQGGSETSQATPQSEFSTQPSQLQDGSTPQAFSQGQNLTQFVWVSDTSTQVLDEVTLALKSSVSVPINLVWATIPDAAFLWADSNNSPGTFSFYKTFSIPESIQSQIASVVLQTVVNTSTSITINDVFVDTNTGAFDTILTTDLTPYIVYSSDNHLWFYVRNIEGAGGLAFKITAMLK